MFDKVYVKGACVQNKIRSPLTVVCFTLSVSSLDRGWYLTSRALATWTQQPHYTHCCYLYLYITYDVFAINGSKSLIIETTDWETQLGYINSQETFFVCLRTTNRNQRENKSGTVLM